MTQQFPILNSTFPFNWESMKPEYIVADTKEAIRIAQENINTIKSIPIEESTFENVIYALDVAKIPVKKMGFFSYLFETFCGEIKEYAEQNQLVSPEMSAFTSSISIDIELFKRVEKVYNDMQNDKTNKTNKYDEDQQRLISETYYDFLSDFFRDPLITQEYIVYTPCSCDFCSFFFLLQFFCLYNSK